MAMGHDDARHLVSRTGLGTPPGEIAALAKLTRKAAVNRVLAQVKTKPTSKLPDWADEPIKPREVLMGAMKDPKAVQKFLNQRGGALKEWWLGEMVATKSPLTERMTLFWHNHFTSSLRKVKRPALLLNQNLTWRKHALGNFDDFVRAVLKDPAMLMYLDNVRNHDNKPNENLGRELLELFTLGEGEYGEKDVKAAARALTGRGVNRRNGEYRFAKWKHDSGAKTLLGKTGTFDGDAIVDVILAHPACAPRIATRLRGEFVTTAPSKREVARLGKVLARKWSIRDTVREVLLSDDFWAPQNRGTRIKSPVELVIGTVRTLELDVPNTRMLVQTSRALGQDVFDPPNVKGWTGGEAWITSNTLLRRMAILSRASRLETKIEDVDAWLGTAYDDRPQADRLRAVLNAVPPMHATKTKDVRKHVQELLSDPTYQLG